MFGWRFILILNVDFTSIFFVVFVWCQAIF